MLRSRFSQSLQQARGPIGEQAGDGGDVGVVPMSPWGARSGSSKAQQGLASAGGRGAHVWGATTTEGP